MKNQIKFHGQAQQDKFVCEALKYPRDGFFVELGACHPINISNTYILEKDLGWRGLAFEQSDTHCDLYETERPLTDYFIGNALHQDYRSIFSEYNASSPIDYLQIDLHPPASLTALEVLKDQVMDDYKFKVVTYEHDICHSRNPVHRQKSREIFQDQGYYRVFDDIHNGEPCWVYEDWYVYPDLVDMNWVKSLQSRNSSHYVSNDLTEKSIGWQKLEY